MQFQSRSAARAPLARSTSAANRLPEKRKAVETPKPPPPPCAEELEFHELHKKLLEARENNGAKRKTIAQMECDWTDVMAEHFETLHVLHSELEERKEIQAMEISQGERVLETQTEKAKAAREAANGAQLEYEQAVSEMQESQHQLKECEDRTADRHREIEALKGERLAAEENLQFADLRLKKLEMERQNQTRDVEGLQRLAKEKDAEVQEQRDALDERYVHLRELQQKIDMLKRRHNH